MDFRVALLICIITVLVLLSSALDASSPARPRLLFVSVSATGHLAPVVTLATAAANSGQYEVVLASEEEARHTVESASPHIQFVSFGPRPYSKDDAFKQSAEKGFGLAHIWQAVSKAFPTIALQGYIGLHTHLEAAAAESRLPDLMLCDYMTWACPTAAGDFGIPTFSIDSALIEPPFVNTHTPKFGSHLRMPLGSFRNRVKNILLSPVATFFPYFVYSTLNNYRATNLSKPLPPISLFQAAASLEARIVTTSFGFEYSKRINPNVFMVGPLMLPDKQDVNLLQQEVRQFLDSDSNTIDGKQYTGVLYVAFGTNVHITADKGRVLFEVFRKLPFRVIWSLPEKQRQPMFPSDEHKQSADRVMIVSWIAQQALLAHPAVKMFLTHCGANSINEALFCGKPLVGMPVFGDQADNAARILDSGVGLTLDYNALFANSTAESIAETVQSTILAVFPSSSEANASSNSFTRKAQRMAAVYREAGGVQRAVDVINMFFRLDKSFHHLKPTDSSLSLVELYNLDMIAVLLVILWVAKVLLFWSVRACFRLVFRSSKKKQITSTTTTTTTTTPKKTQVSQVTSSESKKAK